MTKKKKETKQRKDINYNEDGHTESTEFGLWLRQQKSLLSHDGYNFTNIDFLCYKFKANEFIFLEEKRNQTKAKRKGQPIAGLDDGQYLAFKFLHDRVRHDPKYKGFYLLRFSNTSPENGCMWFKKLFTTTNTKNHKTVEISKEQLIIFFQTLEMPCKDMNEIEKQYQRELDYEADKKNL